MTLGVRPWLLVVLGVVVLGAVGVGVVSVVQGIRRRTAEARAQADAARTQRQTPRIHPTAAPLPQGLPLIGTAGTDTDGYPLQHVDRPGLRALLGAGRFAELTSDFEQLESAFEADPRKEYWPSDAAESFESAEPELFPALDAWIAATPGSFAPYLARGSHWIGVMWARRGARFRADTPDADLQAMEKASKRALADLDQALALHPKLVAAMRMEMRAALPTSDDDLASRMRTMAFAACPGCLLVRTTYLNSLTPRWGGTYAAIQAFVGTLSPSVNPRFAALRGYVEFDLATAAWNDKGPGRFDTVLAHVDRALSYGDYWEYLYTRAQALRGLQRYDEALIALDRAEALRPMHPTILSERAALHANRNEWIAAGHDLLAALRSDPTEPDGKRYATDVLHGMLSTARESDAAGKREDALDAARLVLEICPDDEAARTLLAASGKVHP
jgi:tetratricopeptide (TPR) repeat protein